MSIYVYIQTYVYVYIHTFTHIHIKRGKSREGGKESNKCRRDDQFEYQKMYETIQITQKGLKLMIKNHALTNSHMQLHTRTLMNVIILTRLFFFTTQTKNITNGATAAMPGALHIGSG